MAERFVYSTQLKDLSRYRNLNILERDAIQIPSSQIRRLSDTGTYLIVDHVLPKSSHFEKCLRPQERREHDSPRTIGPTYRYAIAAAYGVRIGNIRT
jgi:hypothetical protein